MIITSLYVECRCLQWKCFTKQLWIFTSITFIGTLHIFALHLFPIYLVCFHIKCDVLPSCMHFRHWDEFHACKWCDSFTKLTDNPLNCCSIAEKESETKPKRNETVLQIWPLMEFFFNAMHFCISFYFRILMFVVIVICVCGVCSLVKCAMCICLLSILFWQFGDGESCNLTYESIKNLP